MTTPDCQDGQYFYDSINNKMYMTTQLFNHHDKFKTSLRSFEKGHVPALQCKVDNKNKVASEKLPDKNTTVVELNPDYIDNITDPAFIDTILTSSTFRDIDIINALKKKKQALSASSSGGTKQRRNKMKKQRRTRTLKKKNIKKRTYKR